MCNKYSSEKGEQIMEIPEEFKGRYFYHFTHIDNIQSIIENEGLLCTNKIKKDNITYHNIASVKIQNKRSKMEIPVGCKGKLHDYVPFYFTTINPMLLGLLNRKVVDQPYICFIAISIEKLLNENVIFTDSSANTDSLPNFYENPEDLSKLDWNQINSNTWHVVGEDRHRKMAEVLVHKKVPLEWFDTIIVFDCSCKDKIQEIYRKLNKTCPDIACEPFHNRYFFFRKFFFIDDRGIETLVTGPIQLKEKYLKAIKEINANRKYFSHAKAQFNDLEDMLVKIENNFCIIPELDGIYELQTDNKIHTESVSNHTIKVANYVKQSKFYKRLNKKNKRIVLLAAYLHDIGKGPKSKWKNGIQPTYPDHPADAIPMIIGILSNYISNITEEEIKELCLLVIYHDLMGDIIGREREFGELKKLNLNETESNMLAALSEADIMAIETGWEINIERELEYLITKWWLNF